VGGHLAALSAAYAATASIFGAATAGAGRASTTGAGGGTSAAMFITTSSGRALGTAITSNPGVILALEAKNQPKTASDARYEIYKKMRGQDFIVKEQAEAYLDLPVLATLPERRRRRG